jgi:hypothetical protein
MLAASSRMQHHSSHPNNIFASSIATCITTPSAASKDSITLTSTPHSLSCLCQPPRYRELGIDALTSAAQHFHGDCTPSFHLLTDNVSGVDPLLNPKYSPFRQWPDSGLSKVLNTTRITSLGATWPGGSRTHACPAVTVHIPPTLARSSIHPACY